MKCKIRLACLSEVQPNGKIKNILLFSTDIALTGEQILEYYQARFQIEFIFRDAKQFTGLSDCWGGDKEVYEIDCIRVAARIPC